MNRGVGCELTPAQLLFSARPPEDLPTRYYFISALNQRLLPINTILISRSEIIAYIIS